MGVYNTTIPTDRFLFLFLKLKDKVSMNPQIIAQLALSSIISKIFEYFILDRIQDQIMLNFNQFGYRKIMSTIACSFIVNQTIEYYKRCVLFIFRSFKSFR